ncbi:hypothetical protein [Mycobacterium paraseoulense]|uniref:Uncharacterized protein n=1 Tax=Mycobacterium paraseoulense TaxID=590652 RepID=A0A1X0IBX7_9MYCO|nr:hypothetical protein [Mycobacterium paraseoulense]MCV7394497.1 hypothetical protein [Mycobacterium paraseoulense]ORB42288.1 hypothetical protein BST39_10725 [Mycobacterium paraseoulense]BBZ73424.1 hypothetical protein MPRS_45170 [Mycobacterium paraseoulense]
MEADRNSDDGETRHEPVFRERWRDRQSTASRPGELIKQQERTEAGLVMLGVLLAAGALIAGTVSIARTEALPAVTQGMTVTASRGGGIPPARGAAVQFRDASGTTHGAVVIDVTATEVKAELDRPVSAPSGELVVPQGRQRLISALMPRLR